MKQLRKSTLHTKSLQTLKSTQILYQRFIEKQFDDDLDRQAMEAGGGEYVYHKQIQPDQEDEDYYMKKRKFLSNDTLSMLNDKYQYNSNFKITDNQMQISNEYLLKVRNMYNELKQGGYTLDKPDYVPYSAREQAIQSKLGNSSNQFMPNHSQINTVSIQTPRVRQDFISMMLSAKRLSQSQTKSQAPRNFKILRSLKPMIMPDLQDNSESNKQAQLDRKKYQLHFKSRAIVKKEFSQRQIIDPLTKYGNNVNINSLKDLWVIESQISLESQQLVNPMNQSQKLEKISMDKQTSQRYNSQKAGTKNRLFKL
eukprot:403338412